MLHLTRHSERTGRRGENLLQKRKRIFRPEESELALIFHAKVLMTWVTFSVLPIGAATIEG